MASSVSGYRLADLMKAIQIGDVKRMRRILSVYPKTAVELLYSGQTPIDEARTLGRHDLVELMLQQAQGATPHEASHYEPLAHLMHAVRRADLKMLGEILKIHNRRHLVQAPLYTGHTVIHEAVLAPHPSLSVVEALLNHGANATQRVHSHLNPSPDSDDSAIDILASRMDHPGTHALPNMPELLNMLRLSGPRPSGADA